MKEIKIYYLGIFFFNLFLFYSCTNSDIVDCPKKIVSIGECDKLRNAKWLIYKLNLLNGEEYADCNYIPSNDNIRIIKTNLYALNLKFDDFQINDNKDITFIVPFEKDLCPNISPYFFGITFKENNTVEAQTSRYSFPIDIEEGEKEFKEYLLSKEASELNPWLLEEAKNRDII